MSEMDGIQQRIENAMREAREREKRMEQNDAHDVSLLPSDANTIRGYADAINRLDDIDELQKMCDAITSANLVEGVRVELLGAVESRLIGIVRARVTPSGTLADARNLYEKIGTFHFPDAEMRNRVLQKIGNYIGGIHSV